MANESIHAAVLAGDASEVNRLARAGHGIDARDRDGRTPLMHAAINGDVALVDLLLTLGANPDTQDNGGWTALHFAVQEHAVAVAERLLSRQATVDLADKFGNTPLWRATFASRGRGELICLLLQAGANRAQPNTSGVSPEDLARTIANYDVKQYFG